MPASIVSTLVLPSIILSALIPLTEASTYALVAACWAAVGSVTFSIIDVPTSTLPPPFGLIRISPSVLVLVMLLPLILILSTLNAVNVPTLVIFPCATVAKVPAIVPPETFIPALKTGIWFIVTTPALLIAIASASEAEPIFPSSATFIPVNDGVAATESVISSVFCVAVIPVPPIIFLSLKSIPTLLVNILAPELPKLVAVLASPPVAPGAAAGSNLLVLLLNVNTWLAVMLPGRLISLNSLILELLSLDFTSARLGPVYVITPVDALYARDPSPPASVTLICVLTSAALGPVYVKTPVLLLNARLPSPPASVTLTAALTLVSV